MASAAVPSNVVILLLLFGPGLEVIKLFMLNSTEHEIYPAHVKMPTIVGFLSFISMINTTSERLKARNFFICQYFSFYEQFLCSVELSMEKVLKPWDLFL